MIKIGILGDIGSGKSYVANNFGHPVFNADIEVAKLYKNNRQIFNKLKKRLPKYIHSFPIDKNEIKTAILDDKTKLKKINNIVHREIKKKMQLFIKKNKNKKIVVLDIPLLLENKIYKKGDILIFVQTKKKVALKRLKKRPNFDQQLFNKFKKIQLPIEYKKKISHFIIKNNFLPKSVKYNIKNILKKILK